MVVMIGTVVWVNIHIMFFFSSRRRHTRWPRDWSSDVCSSDLVLLDADTLGSDIDLTPLRAAVDELRVFAGTPPDELEKIGRASCRERVESEGVGGGRQKKRRGRKEREKA